MRSNSGFREETEAFELKGRMTMLTVLRLTTDDDRALETQLRAKMSGAPAMLRGLPIILELTAVAEAPPRRLQEWLAVITRCGLVPVGIAGGSAPLLDEARALGLGLFTDLLSAPPRPQSSGWPESDASVGERPGDPHARASASSGAASGVSSGAASGAASGPAAPGPGRAGPVAGRIVHQPVRSGQQIYARGGDLVILSSVSPGAEILADGNIHVYGTLRGRALAGVNGDEKARILCRSLEAELVSIAGWYKVSDELGGVEGPVQIYLEGETVCIAPL